MAGYIWFKFSKFMRSNDTAAFQPSRVASRLIRKAISPETPWQEILRSDRLSGGPHAQTIMYSLVGRMRGRYYSDELNAAIGEHNPYEDVPLDLERMKRWHPLNQSLYMGYKTLLPGLLLNHKGDRVAMANSVETRYPFLDEDVIKFAARISPELKLKGRKSDKFLLRTAAERILPKEVAWRPKGMFRAPFAESFFTTPPAFVQQLMSEASLKKTGYFNVASVRRDYESYLNGRVASWRIFLSMGLGGVLSTQLWHHIHLSGGLCELPSMDHGQRLPALAS